MIRGKSAISAKLTKDMLYHRVHWLKSFKLYEKTRYSSCEREHVTLRSTGHEQSENST
jgi:hypothetical protein